jgi:hypothetical protein
VSDHKKRLREITDRIEGILPPVTFIVPLQGTLSVALYHEAMRANCHPETIIAEALRAYLGDA